MISTDRRIFEAGSAVRARQIEYASLFDELHIVVFTKRNFQFSIFNFQTPSKIQIAENCWVYPTNSQSRWSYIFDAIRIGRWIIDDSKFTFQDSVITVQDPFETAQVGLALKRRFGLPLQVQIHTDFLSPYFARESFLNWLRVKMAIYAVRQADSIRVVSHRIKKSLDSRFMIHDSRIQSLPIFVDIEKIKNAPVLANLHKKYPQFDKIILMVCRLNPEKNLPQAIRLFVSVSRKRSGLGMVIVGDGPEKRSLEGLIWKLGVDERIIFAGWQEGVSDFYRTADLFLSTSFYEGFGLASFEAHASGCPVISTDVGIASEIITAKTGSIIPFDILSGRDEILGWLDRGRLVDAETRLPKGFLESKGEYLKQLKRGIEETLQSGQSLPVTDHFWQAVRYVISGGTAAATNLLGLYILADVIGLWYLTASSIATAIAVIVSFSLQKFWTFDSRQADWSTLKREASLYLMIFSVNILLNGGLMFLFVDIFQVWHLIAQVLANALVAVFSFFTYKFFVFKAGRTG